jgi:hypothetical protein
MKDFLLRKVCPYCWETERAAGHGVIWSWWIARWRCID